MGDAVIAEVKLHNSVVTPPSTNFKVHSFRTSIPKTCLELAKTSSELASKGWETNAFRNTILEVDILKLVLLL